MIDRKAGTGLNDASECHMLLPVRKIVFLCELPSTVPSFWTLPMVPKYSTLPTLVWLGSGLLNWRVRASWRSSSIDCSGKQTKEYLSIAARISWISSDVSDLSRLAPRTLAPNSGCSSWYCRWDIASPHALRTARYRCAQCSLQRRRQLLGRAAHRNVRFEEGAHAADGARLEFRRLAPREDSDFGVGGQ